MINLVGTVIEHYQILVKIRETPTRVLYRVYNTRAKNYEALEVVKAPGREPSELLRLINAQVHKNSVLTHPNIAAITDTGISSGLIYIVYNFSPTYPFRRIFNRTYSWQEMARELVSIAHAMGYAHESGVVHGALHPSSIVLDERKNPILFDFGFEKIITDYILARSPGAWINRWGFEYRPPEQLNGAEPDAKCDIYAIGMMLHEWLIGKVALLDSTILGTLRMRLTTPGTVDKKSRVPTFVQDLIQKCIAQNPADRYQSMQEVYIVLARGALDMTITQKMVRKPLEIPTRRINLGQWFARLRTVAIMAILAIAFMSLPSLFGKEVAVTVTPLPSKTKVIPTRTPARPTSTPMLEVETVETPQPAGISFPVFQGTPVSSSAVNPVINISNANQIVMLSTWGIGDVNRLVIAPNGRQIAVASSIGIFVFNAQTLNLEKYIDTRSWVTAIDFSSDSRILASGDRDGLIQLWNTDTWEEAESPYSGHAKAIIDLAFSPDGTKLASVSLDNQLIQWKVNSTDAQGSNSAEVIGGVTVVVYSADNNRLITGGNDFQINIWDSQGLKILQTTAFSSKIMDIADIKDTGLFIVGGNDRSVALLDISNGASLTPVGTLQYALTGVGASPDGKIIAGSDINGGITVWAGNTDNKFIEVWRNKNYTLGDFADPDASGSSHSLAFNPDGTLIFSGTHNGTIRSLDANTGEDIQQNRSFNAHAKNLAVSHNGKYLITQQDTDLLTIWDLWNGTPLYQLQGQIIAGDPFSQDDKMFAVDSSPSEIKVYNPANGNEIYKLDNSEHLKAIQFVRNDSLLITIYDQFMHLWSMSSGQELKTSRSYEGTDCFTIYERSGAFVAYVTNYYHIVENEENRPGLCTFDPLDWKVAINEAREMIAFGGSSKLAIISNIQGPESNIQDMRGVNRKNIVAVALSPNGDLIAAAYDDNTIHLWDINTREEISSLYGHNNSITSLRFTPDGKILISTSLDGTIRLWGIPY